MELPDHLLSSWFSNLLYSEDVISSFVLFLCTLAETEPGVNMPETLEMVSVNDLQYILAVVLNSIPIGENLLTSVLLKKDAQRLHLFVESSTAIMRRYTQKEYPFPICVLIQILRREWEKTKTMLM
jgi:hypothetical protein